MTTFTHRSLSKLQNPELLVAVAKAVHEQALDFVAKGDIPNYYIDAEVYEPGTRKVTRDGRGYNEISRYGDGFGSSIFVLDGKMLLLTSNHELTPLDALESDRDLYLTPLLAGLPREWDFVVDLLQTDERFELNPPVAVFWYENGEWNLTDLYSEIKAASRDETYGDYRDVVDSVDETDLSYLYEHAGETSVNRAIVVAHFDEWKF
jgi:hypothetical protein